MKESALKSCADSILRLPITKGLFSRGRLKIRCVASLHDVYYRSSEKSVELEKKRHREHYAHVVTIQPPITTTMSSLVQWGIMPQASERHPADTTLIFETRQRPYNRCHRIIPVTQTTLAIIFLIFKYLLR
ncbi:hypothetical protein WA026_001204 [Henosepilachna vigintioctopunctata]|uniref:Uncharacterized protein n=1 Tax=Henosepilachna vigintioctopunctata TaxID=420089 RepID=A0AAW1UTW6_9CUCU